jgi:hypothetical protein
MKVRVQFLTEVPPFKVLDAIFRRSKECLRVWLIKENTLWCNRECAHLHHEHCGIIVFLVGLGEVHLRLLGLAAVLRPMTITTIVLALVTIVVVPAIFGLSFLPLLLAVRNRTLTLIEREDDTRSWEIFLVYFSHSTTMSYPPSGSGYILIGC